jgi:hypothetical protein
MKQNKISTPDPVLVENYTTPSSTKTTKKKVSQQDSSEQPCKSDSSSTEPSSN